MNKNGERTKLLAAIAVLAMVVCAFAVVAIPSSDAVTGDEFLKDAENGVITLDEDVTVSSVITVDEPLTINGNGHTITADPNWSDTSGNGTKNIISINRVAGEVVLNDVTFVGANGINVWDSDDVTLNNVTVKDSKGAGLTVGTDSVATVNESSFSNNNWGDINVDKASTLNIDDATKLTSNFQIWSEDVTAAENPSVINADSYVDYRWDKTGSDAVTDGRAYFKNGNVPADIKLTNQTITVAEGQALFIVGGYDKDIPVGITNNGVVYTIPEGTTATESYNESTNTYTVDIEGTAVAMDKEADGIWNELFSTATGTWAAVGFINAVADGTYDFVQTNTALKVAYPDEPLFQDNTKESLSATVNNEADGFNYFLIPKDSSVVK